MIRHHGVHFVQAHTSRCTKSEKCNMVCSESNNMKCLKTYLKFVSWILFKLIRPVVICLSLRPIIHRENHVTSKMLQVVLILRLTPCYNCILQVISGTMVRCFLVLHMLSYGLNTHVATYMLSQIHTQLGALYPSCGALGGS